MQKYCFTIKKLGANKQVNEKSYNKFWRLLKDEGAQLEYFFAEYDSKGKLHYHGLILLRKHYYRKRLYPYGYSLLIRKCTDANGWYTYCTKDQHRFDPISIMYDKTI